MRHIKGCCLLLLVLSLVIGSYYYLDGKEYLAGKEHHYIGTSTVSPDEFIILADAKNVLPFLSITEITSLENGLVEITYDFFSTEDYHFIITAPFSYLDTKFLYLMYEARKGFLYLGGALLIFLLVYIILNKYPLKIKDGENKAANVAWYVTHPRYLFNRKTATPLYSPQIETDIKIYPQDAGIYAVRTWKYKSGYLYSTGLGQARWENKILLTDKPLSENNESGVYSCRLGVVSYAFEFIKGIIGIVSLSGEWFEHADGVLRAESCEILSLIVSHYHKPVASVLSSTYGVPVVVADNPINAYMNWLFSENGTVCLKHNAEILKGETDGNERARNPKRKVAIEITSSSPGS